MDFKMIRFWFLMFILYTCTLCHAHGNGETEFPEVNIKSGRIRGKLSKSFYDNKSYYSFLGIPFAMPPLNELRFLVNKFL